MFSSFSYRVLFQRFFPQNISLLPKIVTEAHANLKKKKTSCNIPWVPEVFSRVRRGASESGNHTWKASGTQVAATLLWSITLLCSHGQVHPFGTFESFESDLLTGSIFFPFIHHQFIIEVHMDCSALVHSAQSPGALSFYEQKEGRVSILFGREFADDLTWTTLLLFVTFFIHFLNLLKFIECLSPSLLIKSRRWEHLTRLTGARTTILFIIQELVGRSTKTGIISSSLYV